jgi:hypothetical protein
MSKSNGFIINELVDKTLISVDEENSYELDFHKINLRRGLETHFDFKNLKILNSIMIRDWIQWSRLYAEEKWLFYHCMPAFINQINMIDRFLPKRSKIESIYVPYYSKGLDEETMVLLTREDNYPTGNSVKLPEVLDSQGEPMEVDVLPEKFFRFLYIY